MAVTTRAGLALFLLPLTACASLSNAAKQKFATLATCPPERVTVVANPDFHPPPPPPEAPPPPDVASDPGRLAFWTREHDALRARAMRACDEGFDAFEATGCGMRQILCCAHPTNPNGTKEYSNQVICAHPWPMTPVIPQGAPAGSAAPIPSTAPATP
jgi:hypothetical protein